MLNKLLKSVLDQDTAPVVVCDMDDCSDCHTSGMDEIIALCLNEKSKNPIRILEKMMSMDLCHMHGPEHHVMVGAALLTAYKNAGGEIDLLSALSEMYARRKQVPGGAVEFNTMSEILFIWATKWIEKTK